MTIGNKIKSIRKSKFMTLQDMQNITKLSKSTISAIERNKSNPNIITLKKIASALDVSVESLLKDKST